MLHSKHWIRLFWLGFFGLLLLSVGVILFEPTPAEQLAAARERWARSGIGSYRVMLDFDNWGYNSRFVMAVQDGTPIAAEHHASPFVARNPIGTIPAPQQYALLNAPTEMPGQLGDLTVEELFHFAETILADETPWPPFAYPITFCTSFFRHEVEFDELGYIREIRYTWCPVGLMCSSTPDCTSSVSIVEFEPLSE